MGLFGITEEEVYQANIEEPLDRKIEKAVALIRQYEPMALEFSEEGFYVAFSGGKDSIVMARLFEMAGVRHQLWYNNVTIDPPELVQFIKRQYPEVKWNNPGKNLPLGMASSAHPTPPTRLARWCCEEYKEQGGKDVFRAIGVRTEESARRKGMWTTIKTDHRTGKPIMCPVLYWTSANIWEFIRQNEMPYCSLYDEGFSRLGCVGCPMGSEEQQLAQFKRWPKYEQMWRRGFQKLWDEYRGVPKRNGEPRAIEKFKSVEDHWNWWISGKAYEGDKPDCQLWLW